MIECADFPAVNNFLKLSLVVQATSHTDEQEVGPRMMRGKNGERGILVVAENPLDGGSKGTRMSAETFDDLTERCQEDDDSAAEDVAEYRRFSFPESKQAPYYARLRIGLDTRDTLPAHPGDGPIERLTNTNKVTCVAGLDNVVSYTQLPKDEEGNAPFTLEQATPSASNRILREHMIQIVPTTAAIIIDDREQTGAFWNMLGEILMAAVVECAPNTGVVKVFAIATPSVIMAGGKGSTKIYDLSKLSETDEDAAAASEPAAPRRGPQLPVEPSIQYDPASDEYDLQGVSAVDLLLPPELDPELPSERETPQQRIERKREAVPSLLHVWMKAHQLAALDDGSAHVVIIVQRIPNSDTPDVSQLSVITGLHNEAQSHLVKEEQKRNKPAPNDVFRVWSKDMKEGEHHSQRLVGAAISIATLVREVMKIMSRGSSAAKEIRSGRIRELVRSHAVTRLLKGSVVDNNARVAWFSCLRRGPLMQVGHHNQPYTVEDEGLQSFVVPPSGYVAFLRTLETIGAMNKYRLRREAVGTVRDRSPQPHPPTTGAPRRSLGSSRRGMLSVRRPTFVAKSVQQKRYIFLKQKLFDMEARARSAMLMQERALRVKIERMKTEFRLREYAARRKQEMESKRKDVRAQMQAAVEDRKRRMMIRRKRQFTPPGRKLASWVNPKMQQGGPAARRRPVTPPPAVPKRIVRQPPPPKPKEEPKQASSLNLPWARPQLGGDDAKKPNRPASKAPLVANPRGQQRAAHNAALQGAIKNLEADEFMKRTLSEQEWQRGVRRLIGDVFDDVDESVADRLLALLKSGAQLLAKQLSDPSMSHASRSSKAPPHPPPISQKPSAPSMSSKASMGSKQPSGSFLSAAAQRESNLSPQSDHSGHDTESTVSGQQPVIRVQQSSISTSKYTAPQRNDSIHSTTRADKPEVTAPPQSHTTSSVHQSTTVVRRSSNSNSTPAAAPPRPPSSHSSRSSQRSSRSSSPRRSPSRSPSNSRTPSPKQTSIEPSSKQRSDGPMVPIPIESAFTAKRAPTPEEEYYKGSVRKTELVGSVRTGGVTRTVVRSQSNMTSMDTPDGTPTNAVGSNDAARGSYRGGGFMATAATNQHDDIEEDLDGDARRGVPRHYQSNLTTRTSATSSPSGSPQRTVGVAQRTPTMSSTSRQHGDEDFVEEIVTSSHTPPSSTVHPVVGRQPGSDIVSATHTNGHTEDTEVMSKASEPSSTHNVANTARRRSSNGAESATNGARRRSSTGNAPNSGLSNGELSSLELSSDGSLDMMDL